TEDLEVTLDLEATRQPPTQVALAILPSTQGGMMAAAVCQGDQGAERRS
ncbi:MAG: hypothetical protein ACI9KE_004379, partial [Polyangiales bacterium]